MKSFRPLSQREFSHTLRERQREMEATDRFSEAEELNKEIERIKLRDELASREIERERQVGEKDVMETAHLQQFLMLKEEWDNNLALFAQETQQLESSLLQRLSDERQDLEASLSRPSRVKLSPHLLNLKERKQQAIKQRRYKDAQSLTVEIQTLMQEFGEKAQQKLGTQAQKLLAAQAENHRKELRAFQQKRQIQLEELKKDRETAIDWLCKKYDKNRKELEGLHRHQQVQPRVKTMAFTTPISIARVLAASKSSLFSPRGPERTYSRLSR